MGQMITLTAADGHEMGAYETEVDGAGIGVVVVQEIFGVNEHIRRVVDRFAGEGMTAVAPALFDRLEPNFESGYSDEEVAHAKSFISRVDWDDLMRDTEAAIDHLKTKGLKVAVVGFCLGGSVAFTAATRIPGLSSAVGYYGGKIAGIADEVPGCPTLLHFGAHDASIPMEDVEKIRQARPDVEIHVYDAGHGFNCDSRSAYAPEAAKLAWERTIAHIRKAAG